MKINNVIPILSECIILSSLLNKTSITQQYLHQGLSLNEIAIAQNVKLNTIEDHILELFIKGYEKNYENYVEKRCFQFTQYYTEHKGERLKYINKSLTIYHTLKLNS